MHIECFGSGSPVSFHASWDVFFVRVAGPDGYGWWWSDANEVQLGEDEETVWRTAEEEEEEEKGIS